LEEDDQVMNDKEKYTFDIAVRQSMFTFFLFILVLIRCSYGESINGGSFLALAGKDSVVLATDSRFSSGGMLLGKHYRDIFRIGSSSLVGFYGLESDSYPFLGSVKRHLQDYREEDLTPEQIASLISTLLYQNKGLQLVPIFAGLGSSGVPFICSFDSLGAETKTDSFAAVGTSTSGLLSILESFYCKDLTSEELCSLTERCLKLAFQRDILSGGDIKIATLRKDGIFVKTIKMTDV
jgi:20S proteasome subunit beta 3